MDTNVSTISAATINDAHEVAVLFNAYRMFYAQADDLPLATAFIRQRLQQNDSTILLARNEAQHAIGFCQMYPTFCSVAAAPILVLYDLFVTPTLRGSGAGRALLLAAHEYAKQAGVVRMDLSTAKNNLPAQALYESLGWQKDTHFFTYSLALRVKQ
jgi:ribosomal protein S18 acetylase RimI-like enzyme